MYEIVSFLELMGVGNSSVRLIPCFAATNGMSSRVRTLNAATVVGS
jgi:hypothetical protein